MFQNGLSVSEICVSLAPLVSTATACVLHVEENKTQSSSPSQILNRKKLIHEGAEKDGGLQANNKGEEFAASSRRNLAKMDFTDEKIFVLDDMSSFM